MKMPNITEASVERRKVTHYLLSDTHEIGKSKSVFFKSFGYDNLSPTILEEALRTHAIERDIYTKEETIYGVKYKLRCELNTPDQRNPCIFSVWIIDKESGQARLITAYPAE